MPFFDTSTICEYHAFQVEARCGTKLSSVIVKEKFFTRYVFRPIAGHDILTAQKKSESDVDLWTEHDSWEYYKDDEEALKKRIKYDLHDYNRKNWTPFATKMAAFIGEHHPYQQGFKAEADEARGELHVMDERKGWHLSDEMQTQAIEEICAICLDDLTDEVAARMGLPCGHVFDKECLTEWIWNKPQCPACRAQIPSISPHQEEF